jgi:hypothetical protein
MAFASQLVNAQKISVTAISSNLKDSSVASWSKDEDHTKERDEKPGKLLVTIPYRHKGQLI